MNCCSPTPDQPLTPAEIDRSARWPLLIFFAKATGWLAVGMGLALVAAIKLVAPTFWDACPWVTYGRVAPAAQAALFYGFASQAGLGVALWLVARMGGVAVQNRWLVFVGGGLWNLGCFLGVLGILGGDGTGYHLLAMPIYGSGLVWFGLLAISLALFQTFARRKNSAPYPSQWFVLTAVFWFFWVLTAGIVLLHCVPQRGVLQLVASTWAANNLLMLWLTPLGLAVVLYFVPKLLNRPLFSASLAKTTFWILAVFGTGCGFHYGMPLPRWLPSISIVCDLLLLVAVLALALNLHRTAGGDYRAVGKKPGLFLMAAGALAWMFAVLLQVVLAQPGIRDVLLFTWTAALKNQLLILGFAVPVMLGALGQIIPQLAKREWPCQTVLPFLTQLGFSLGTLLFALGSLWAGNAQAGVLSNPATVFTASLTDAQAGLKLALGGMVIMSAGAAAFALNALLLGWHSVRPTLRCGAPDCGAGAAAEVAS